MPRLFSLLVLCALAFGCDSSDNDASDIAPGDAAALSQAISIAGAERQDGAPPAPSTDDAAPSVSAGAGDVPIAPGGGVTLNFLATARQNIAGIYVAIAGANQFFVVSGSVGSNASFTFTLPSNIVPGTFQIVYCVYDVNGLVSNLLTTTITVDSSAGATASGGGAGNTDGGTIDWRRTATPVRGTPGRQFSYDCPAGGTFSTVWGTDLYTDDSSICTAAVHVGRITVQTGGRVTIETRDGASSYAGSSRNGVNTSNWGAWGNSFVVL